MKKIIYLFKNLSHRITVISLVFVIFFIVIPTTGFIEGVYGYSVGKFEKTLIKTIQTETESYANLLKKEFQTIKLQMYNLLADDMVNMVRVKFEMDRKDTYFALQLRGLQSYMRSIKNCHNLADSIELYYPSVLRKITINSQIKYESVKNEELEKLINSSNVRNIYNDSEYIVCWDRKGTGNGLEVENISGMVVSKISKQTMKNCLSAYGENREAIFAVSADINSESCFFLTTDAMLQREHLPDHFSPGEYLITEIGGEKYLMTCSEAEKGIWLYQILPFDSISVMLKEHREIMDLFIGALVFLAGCFSVLFYLIIDKPIEHAKKTFLRLEHGELGIQMGKSWYIEFQGMYDQFNSMSRHIQYLIEQEYELRLLNTKVRMKQLQCQISPHFLYNTYFILCGLLQEEDYEGAEQMASIIGKYLRYITVSGNDTASLQDELEHARAYTQIQQIRFSRRISIYFDECPPELKGLLVPRIIVQPLIENAFEHGVKDCLEGGVIRVSITGNPSAVTICVEDNGDSLSEEKIREMEEMLQCTERDSGDHVALFNIHRRLVMTYGAGSGLFLSRSGLGGMRLELRIREGDTSAENLGC